MKSLALVALSAILLTGCQTESAPESLVETLESSVEATPVAFNSEGAPTTEMHVPDMMCQYSCAAKVKEVLASQTGVKDVKIDFDTRKAIVAVDESTFDGEAAVAALVDFSFSNTKLLTAEAN